MYSALVSDKNQVPSSSGEVGILPCGLDIARDNRIMNDGMSDGYKEM